jgi:hypothetical protein
MVDSAAALSLFPLKLAVIQEGNPAFFNATARFEKPPAQRTQLPFASGDLLLNRSHDARPVERT